MPTFSLQQQIIHVYLGDGVPIRKILFNRINKMDSKIGFEMSLVVVEAIRGRCASFTVLTATVLGDILWTDKSIYFSIIDKEPIL